MPFEVFFWTSSIVVRPMGERVHACKRAAPQRQFVYESSGIFTAKWYQQHQHAQKLDLF